MKRAVVILIKFDLTFSLVTYICDVGINELRLAAVAQLEFLLASGSDGAASSYHVKQLEEQNSRLKEALVR